MLLKSSWRFYGVVLVGLLSLMAGRAAGESPLPKLKVNRGLCVVLGDADGSLAMTLASNSELTIFVQSPRADEMQTLRKMADAAGLLGKRIYVQQGPYKHINLANDLADYVLVNRQSLDLPQEEVLRVLRPEGVAVIDGQQVVKPVAGGSDEWSHPYHAPDNNPQSNDQVIRRPYLTHFMAEPWYCPLSQMTVISGGRMFKAFGDRSSARPQETYVNTLLAMSAFNGAVLWKRDLTPGFMVHRNTLVATPTTLYLADDKSCQLIDAATGEVTAEIVAPPALSDGPVWKWLALENNVLYALVGEKELPDEALRGDRLRGAGWPWWKINKYAFGFGRTLLAIDPQTRKVIWSHREPEPIDSRALCLRGGRLYFYSDQKFLACHDAATGRMLWKNNDQELLEAIGVAGPAQNPLLGFASTAYMKCGDDVLLFAGPQRPRLVAASTKDGKLLWQHRGGNVQLVLRKDALYALGEGRINSNTTSLKLDPLSGEVLAEFASRDRCTRATGCADSIFTRGGAGGSTAVFDVSSQQVKLGVVSPMRPACTDGVVAAHGHLFWGPWMCRCDLTQLGVISLAPGGSFDYTAVATDTERLETAAAVGDNATPLVVTDDDWPTYRKDNARSVTVDRPAPTKVAERWQFKPVSPTMPTAPVAAAGLVLVGGADGIVRALDAATGRPRWTSFTGGGAMKYPPAIAQGRAYVGGGDGWVYCLDASNGRLQWRFRAAPVERMMPVYGTLTSTWPVGSGVLVDKSVVYAAAGISNYDGTHIYALDAVTGKIRWQNHTSGDVGHNLPDGGVSVQGHLLLHHDAIYMAAGNQLSPSKRPEKPVETSVATYAATRTPVATIAAYQIADGAFSPAGSGRGKDLFVRGGKVSAAGYPLYWRPEDDQFLSPMELETPQGVMAVTTTSVARLAPAAAANAKPTPLWTNNAFQEIAAVAFTRDAVLVTGLDRDARELAKIEPAVTAISLVDGKPIWKQPLPAAPTAWGLAIDRANQLVVTLVDGRVVCFGER